MMTDDMTSFSALAELDFGGSLGIGRFTEVGMSHDLCSAYRVDGGCQRDFSVCYGIRLVRIVAINYLILRIDAEPG